MNVDFRMTIEQRMLRDTLSAYLADNYGAADRAALTALDGFVDHHWRRFATELGILAIPLPSDLGGFGDTAVETMLVMQEFGRALVAEPYLESVVIGATLLANGSAAGGKAAHEKLEAVVEGSDIVALAHAEARARYELARVATRAVAVDGGYLLSGEKAQVVGAPWASDLIVSARIHGGLRDEDGIALFLVPIGAQGVARRDYATIDGRRAAEISLASVRVSDDQVIGRPGEGLRLLYPAMDLAAIALSAEAVGCMRAMLAASLNYAANRRQFGKPLSAFQVQRHAMVDMFVMMEKADALTHRAALEPSNSPDRGQWAAAARAMAAKAAKLVAESAVQIHGAIGTTEELPLGSYFKRLTVIRQQFGDMANWLDRYADAALPRGDQREAANPPSTVSV